MAIQIKWNKKALRQFDDAVAYLEKETITGAENVKRKILLKIGGLSKHPEQFNPDKYKMNNDGSFRAFETAHYRISYRFTGTEIRIIRIRHTRMNPWSY